jgi:CheY-like chemotaxis protein
VVRLPAAPDQARPSGKPSGTPSGASSLARGRILVTDDEPFVRAAVVRLLRGEHDVVEAASGRAAAALLATDDRFDVILTDLVMPEVSGMDFYDGLSSTRPDLAARVVFMTGGVFTERAVRFLERHPNIRIEKPIDSASLRQVVRVLVAARGTR